MPSTLETQSLTGETNISPLAGKPSGWFAARPVIPFKRRLLETAWTNFKAGEPRDKDLRPAYDEFCARQAHWLEDYALFRALKEKYRASRCGSKKRHL